MSKVEEEGVGMGQAFDELMEDKKLEGMQEGRKEGIKEGMKAGERIGGGR